ncbi:uncharacterized protein LOC113380447 [Ctenocephalides felis]|uniref:uncharacterized protein LOC113380447 n=1 Tax=Ctenocephalides felis TaxID=7515 RepID=UPI000E6E18E4|nr:uncharacterized protein LOC113380447 [Ctenocephalides felis]
MFRQIRVNEEHQNLQRILWRENIHDKIKCFNLSTVTYGTACAPYLAIRCLNQLVLDEGESFPLASRAVQHDCYVDDIISGANSLEEAIKLKEELIQLFNRGNFQLHKWTANNSSIIDSVPLQNLETNAFNLTDNKNIIKALGLLWDPKKDVFQISSNASIPSSQRTKRAILSSIAKIFDPLGLISPCVVLAKLIMQDIWQLKTDWDEVVDSTIMNRWLDFENNIIHIQNIIIPRPLFELDKIDRIEIRGFCDASMKAYGACLYIKTNYHNRKPTVRLLCSKSRVAPLKSITLPRLELCAALLLTRLYKNTVKSLNFKVDNNYFWSNSSITLCWIITRPEKLKQFVGNRVAEIQTLNNIIWRHVPTTDNPADFISRGIYGHKLINMDLWWYGLAWLKFETDSWPSIFKVTDNINFEVPEQTIQRKINTCAQRMDDMFLRFSCFNKLQRVMAYCIRFIKNCKNTTVGPLTVTELQESLHHIVKIVQKQNFEHILKYLNSGSAFLGLNLDLESITRWGRIQMANIEYEQKFPLLLPADNHLTNLILKREHVCFLHVGPQTVFWPIKGRIAIKRIIKNCVRCFRFNSTSSQQIMGNLTIERVTIARPFLNAGVDYAGPINLRTSRLRKAPQMKGYIALFICFSTKAIHLELVTSLTTDAFIAALKRFISRRGKCSKNFSDTGTNFIGARHELHKLYNLFKNEHSRNEVINEAAVEGIEWKFNPPNAPHFGGLWESAVKLIKHHLRKVVGETCLTYEEFSTVLTQIEAIVNSRPITSVFDDSNEPTFLSPGHFLIGEALTAFPEPSLIDVTLSRLSLWQQLNQLKDKFWKRWSIEYLGQLQSRYKWKTSSKNFKIDDIVLLKEDNLPPLSWLPGRVIGIAIRKVKNVRVATVKAKNGIFIRPIVKLCPLPVGDVE